MLWEQEQSSELLEGHLALSLERSEVISWWARSVDVETQQNIQIKLEYTVGSMENRWPKRAMSNELPGEYGGGMRRSTC